MNQLPKPNMASTPAENEVLMQNALARLTILRTEWEPIPTSVEQFICDVLEGKL